MTTPFTISLTITPLEVLAVLGLLLLYTFLAAFLESFARGLWREWRSGR